MPEGETPPVQAVEQTQEHVEDAVEQVTEAVTTAPTEAIHDVLASVKDVLTGVQAELKRSNDLAEKSIQTAAASDPPAPVTPQAATPASTPAEPEVHVETPTPQERKVRRGGRKVARRGK